MALSSGSSAIWSDINGIYSTLRSVQRTHGLSQTGVPNSAGGRINASDISTLNNAINALNSERHISMRTNVTNPSVGSLIYPGIISTLKSKIDGVSSTCHNDSFQSFSHNTFFDWFDSCFSSSKRNLKENIHIFDQSALDIINQTKIVNFNYIADPEKNYKVGFIADDTNEILATKNHDKMDMYNSIGILMKAVQELDQKISKEG